MSAKPLRDDVLITRLEKTMETSTGIILTRNDDADKAKVLAIGPQVTEVNVGDVVLANWNKSIKALEDTYLISVKEIVFVFE